jgi:UDPglucose 6-dehydrogenase
MNVGVVGLGKLGLPVAYSMAARGLDVYGYDPLVQGPPSDTSHEQDFDEVIQQAGERMRFCLLDTVIENCDVVFVAVQTPHDPKFEGITPLPDERVDFDYSYLKHAIAAIGDAAFHRDRFVTIAVISTVLPGTMEREIVPLMGSYLRLVYNPSFIAMGTTIRDFLDPEFVLLGGDEDGAVDCVYRHVFGDEPHRVNTTVENAELVKVAYNTFIGLKIAFANTLMEVCHKTGCDVDEVTGH